MDVAIKIEHPYMSSVLKNESKIYQILCTNEKSPGFPRS